MAKSVSNVDPSIISKIDDKVTTIVSGDKNKICYNKIVSSSNKNTKSENSFYGWYYDKQLQNPLTSVSLWSNRKLKVNEDSSYGWEEPSDKDDNNYEFEVPLCNSIISEDFTVQISNNWQDAGTDLVGQKLTEVVQSAAPYIRLIKGRLQTMKLKQDDLSSNEEKEVSKSKIASWLKAGVNFATTTIPDWLNNSGIDIGKILENSYSVQGQQFAYFAGTGVNFGNLSIRFTVFPKYTSEGDFKSVNDQLNDLYPYLMGELRGVSDSGVEGFITKTIKRDGEDVLALDVKGVKDDDLVLMSELDEYFKIVKPPIGYKSVAKTWSEVGFPGTIELRVGTKYKINNLVISDATLIYSKQMVKNPKVFTVDNTNKFNSDDSLSPLFCDVVLTLRACARYTDKNLRDFVNRNTNEEGRRILGNLYHMKSVADNTFNTDNNS